MFKFIFPYHLVNKNERIIIYGFGEAGKDFYKQIKANNYCQIIAVVDKYKTNCLVKNFNILSDDKHDSKYDKIIISISNPSMAYDIKQDLLLLGISENKIVWDNPIKEAECDKDILSKLNDNPSFINVVFDEFRIFEFKNRIFFTPLIKEISKLSDNILKVLIEKIMLSCENTLNKILFLSILYDSGRMAPNYMEDMMKYILSLPSDYKNDVAVLGCGYVWMPMHHPECKYDLFNDDMKLLHKKICKDFSLKLSRNIAQKNKDVKKIAFVLMCFHGGDAGYQGLMSKWVNLLCDIDCIVEVFVTDTLSSEFIDSYQMQGASNLANSVQRISENINKFHRSVKVHYRVEKKIINKLQGLIDEIECFNPDIIVDASDDCFPQGYLLKDKYPILNMPIRSHANGSYYFRRLVFGKNIWQSFYEKMGIKYEVLKDAKMSRLINIKKDKFLYSREDFGLSEDDFIIITVSGRLNVDITDKIGLEMKNLMERHKNIRWILVGNKPGLSHGYYKDLLENKRIIYWGYEKNLEDLFHISDVYLKHEGTGGGVSIRTAMYMGLPIAMIRKLSDSIDIVGIENTVDGDYKDVMKFIEKLYNDKDFYIYMSNKMKNNIMQSMDNEGEELYKVICETHKEYFDDN